MKFSIVIVTYNRKKELELCLDSIKQQQCPHAYEVIVIFNGELSYFEKTKAAYPGFKCFYMPSSSPSAARNYGLTKAMGDYFFFLDDDCILPADYLKRISFHDWDVLGGPDQTSPDSSEFQKTLGQVLASPLCMGQTRFRHQIDPNKSIIESDESKLILCNLWMSAHIFREEGHRFDTELFRNEENFLLKKLKLENKIIKYDPSLFVFHSRRNTWSLLANAVMKSGECRVLNFAKLPVMAECKYFLPLIFNLLLFTWIFNLSSKLGFFFIIYILAVVLSGLIKYRSMHWRFLVMHFFILFMYSLGLVK